VQEGERPAVEAFPILCQSATAAEPGETAFDDPALGQDGEALGLIRPLDDLDRHPRQNACDGAPKPRSLIAAVGEKRGQERKGAEQGRHQHRAPVTVLDVGGVNDRMHKQALRIDEDVALFAHDLLAGVVTRRIDAGPLFLRS